MKLSLKQVERIDRLSRETGRRFRALIVDDEPWVSSTFREFCLLSPQIDVDVACNGLEALEKLTEESYDFATVDLIMPELSGVETVGRIKQISPGLPVMIVTGNATEKLKEQAGCAGACKILEKPVDVTEFLAEVLDILERNTLGTGR